MDASDDIDKSLVEENPVSKQSALVQSLIIWTVRRLKLCESSYMLMLTCWTVYEDIPKTSMKIN